MWESFKNYIISYLKDSQEQINHSLYTSIFSMILSCGDTMHTQTEELKSKQHNINAYIAYS